MTHYQEYWTPERAKDYCQRAVAYLKVASSNTGAGVQLPLEQGMVLRHLEDGLYVAYLVDEGDQFSYVQGYHLQQAGLAPDTLHVSALNNLVALANKDLSVQQYGPVFGAFIGGHFEASLILLDGIWESSLADLLPNGVVATFPARDVLAFCDAGSPDGIEELKRMPSRLPKDASHLLTPQLYQRKGREWRLYSRDQ